jgi:glycosyltransferase involved in cell wall biosynthesis
MSQPFFSIGITTYNRHDLLKEALASILSQDFTDFEVIVGNDYQAEILNGEILGVSDPRIRFVNHPQNLREIGNMNSLLELASGRYFTWLFDDDLYEPGFLQTAYEVLAKTGFPPAFFSSYKVVAGSDIFCSKTIAYKSVQLLSGREYLHKYFTHQLKIISTCGLFETVSLRNIVGGVEELCTSAIGLYSEYLLLVRCALLGRIAYIDAPFVIFRSHSGSWTESNADLTIYFEAGENLVRRCAEVLRREGVSVDFEFDLRGVCKLHLTPLSLVSARVELAQGKSGVCAALNAINKVTQGVAAIRNVYIHAIGVDRYWTRFLFFLMKIKCICMVLHTFGMYWMKKLGVK